MREVTRALAPFLDRAQILDVLRTLRPPLIGDAAVTAALINWDAGTFDLVRAFGEAGEETDIAPGLSLNADHPWSQAARSGEPVFTSSTTTGRIVWGQDCLGAGLSGGRIAAAILPLPGVPRARGVLSVTFRGEHVLDDDEQTFLLSLAGLVGQALDRAAVVAQKELQRAELEDRNRRLEDLNAELRGYTLALERNVGEPIRRVRDFLALVMKRLDGQLDERTRRLFDFARLEADQLAERVAELRALALIERRDLRWEEVDLNQLLVQVRHDLEPLTRERKVRWRMRNLPRARGDHLLLWQVFMELLAFLIEDSWERETPEIEVEAETQDGHLRLMMRDNGKGFVPEVGERLFEVLDRSVPRRTGLARLGLSNVRRVVNRHGGRVWAEGKEGEGTTFFVVLPREGA